MKAIKAMILFLLLLPALLLSACFDPAEVPEKSRYVITIINQSETPIHQIQYSIYNLSGGVMNADGSPIRRGEKVQLDCPMADGQVLLSARDPQDKTLAAAQLKLQFNADGQMMVYVQETAGKLDFLLSP